MAIYHCSIKIISRGKGKSAVAAAAYRSGSRIINQYDNETHDYTNKKGVVYTEIILPDNAPKEFENRSILWNSVEKAEKQINSQLAREIEIALPCELSTEQNISLARRYVKEQFVNKGMCADIAVHDKKDGNPHCHIMLTMRPLNQDGSWGAKVKKIDKKRISTTDWDNRSNAELWRKAWADIVNAELEHNGSNSHIDHRSYERQGIEQIPTIHLGVIAFRLEQRGIETELGNRNREINALNLKLRQIKARIRKLEDWKVEILKEPPTLYEIFSELNKHSEQNRTQRQRLDGLKLASQTLIFIEKYEIETLSDMANVIKNLRLRYDGLKSESYKKARRYKTLAEHIKQGEAYVKNCKVYEQWRNLKGNKENAFYEKHKTEIDAFTDAHNYMTRHLNGRKEIPLDAWKREFESVSNEHKRLVADSDLLYGELRSAEAIKRNADRVMGVKAKTHNKVYGIGD